MSRCSDRVASLAARPDGSGPAASDASWSADSSSQRKSINSRLAEARVDDVVLRGARIVDRLVELVEVRQRFVDDLRTEQLAHRVVVERVDRILLRVEQREHLRILLGRHTVSAIDALAHVLD